MSTIIAIVIIIGVVAVLLGNKKNTRNHKDRNPIKGKRILTMNEQPTFFRLKDALPEHIILTQVSFSAFMTAKGLRTRNLFNRKIADFVVLDESLNIIAIVELDDSSHKGKEDQDAYRDALIAEAGYKVIRYKRTPNFEQVQKDFGILNGSSSVIVKPKNVFDKTKLIVNDPIYESELKK